MPIATRYLFIVSMDVAPEKENLFNEVYDAEHMPNLAKVPGVRAVTRLPTEPARFVLGGQAKELTGEGAPKTWRSTRSTAPRCWKAQPGRRPRRRAAGRPRSAVHAEPAPYRAGGAVAYVLTK